MKQSWRKTLESEKDKIVQSTASSLVITIAVSFWYFAHRGPFVWRPISPIPQPGFFAVEFYGIIAYLTIGAILFYVFKFWLLLRIVCVDMVGSWDLYNGAKWVVRIILALVTQFYIVPTIINILNHIASFFYNAWFLLLYISPTLGTFVALIPLSFYLLRLYHKYKMRRNMEALKQ